MTTIKTSCPECGEVVLSPEEIELVVFPDGEDDDFYTFVCPIEGHRMYKPADVRVVRLLETGGIKPVERRIHPERPDPDLPALTPEDEREFSWLVQDDGRLAEAVEELIKEYKKYLEE